jgi:glycosidase
LDSHDTHRFFTLVSEDKERLHAALALLFLYPGAPCVYYGTEILLPGGYDPDCRRCMDWEAAKIHTPTMELLRKLSELRENMALRYGKVRMYEENGMFVLERQYHEEMVRLVMKDREFEILCPHTADR